ASTNGRFGFARDSYELTARFTQIGQLRPNAPVKIGGVTVGRVAKIDLDPERFDSIVTLAIDARFDQIPIDTSASILTGGLLGESYVGLQPGGDMEVFKPGEELVLTTPAVDLMQMVGKYMFSGGGDNAARRVAQPAPAPPAPAEGTHPSSAPTATSLPWRLPPACSLPRPPCRWPRRPQRPPRRRRCRVRPANWCSRTPGACWKPWTRAVTSSPATAPRCSVSSAASSTPCSTATTPRARCSAATAAAPRTPTSRPSATRLPTT